MRHIALVLAAALTLAACGDDGGGSDTAAFCDIDAQIEALGDPTTPEEGEEFLSDFQELVAEGQTVAPDEISDDVDLVVETVSGVTFEDFATLESSEFNDSVESIGAWATENC